MSSAAKKSAAYREGRADKSKKPSIEIEIKPEGEEEEGPDTEEMDGTKSPTNRKRSAKGAKNTKAPMDGGPYGKKPMDGEGCGCGGRKGKGTCDGNCGKKMDRNDALTPQEYLAACELGIQGRSRSYIRARLDATERLDLKCGKGAISPGEKCTKGSAQKVQPNQSRTKRTRNRALRNAVLTGAAMGVGLGALELATYGQMRKKAAQSSLSKIKNLKAKGNDTLVAALKSAQNSQAMGMNDPHTQARQYANIMQAKTTRGLARQAVRENLAELKRMVPKSPARRRAARRGRRDSVYATGFSPELDQLAI